MQKQKCRQTNAQFLRSTVAYWVDPWNAYQSSKPGPKSQRFAKSERLKKKTVKKQYKFVIFVRFAQK